MDNDTPWRSASSQVMMQKHDHECVGGDESDKDLQRLAIVRHEGAASYLPGFTPFTEQHGGLLSDKAGSIRPGTCVSLLAFMENKSLSALCWRAWGWVRGKGQSWAGWNQHHGESKRFGSQCSSDAEQEFHLYPHSTMEKKQNTYCSPLCYSCQEGAIMQAFQSVCRCFVTSQWLSLKKMFMSATFNCQLRPGSWEWMQTSS